MSNIKVGDKVLFFKYAHEFYWCEIVDVTTCYIHLKNLKRPDDKLMKTKVFSKVLKIPLDLLT